MKKFALVFAFICMCLLSQNASASYVDNPTTPVVFSGTTYNYYTCFWSNPADHSAGGQCRYYADVTNVSVIKYPTVDSISFDYLGRYAMVDAFGGHWSYLDVPVDAGWIINWGQPQINISMSDPLVGWKSNIPGIETITPQLTVTLNPQAGGTVASDPSCLTCSNGTCTGTYTLGNVTLTATPSTDYAFGYWDNGVTAITDNPYVLTMNGNKTLTAKFFKTFTNRVESFQASTGSTIDTGECVPYVRYETGVPIYGDAYTWYGQAASANYATSATVPRIGSIIVFAIQGGMTSGHVGIVTSISGSSLGIRSQNWHNDGKVSDDTVDVSGYTITGYIYYTP
jgi:surface antigen